MVAFLKTLKSPAKYRSPVDDPDKRPPPVENRDNLDDLRQPGHVDRRARADAVEGERPDRLRPARPATPMPKAVQDLGGAHAEMGAAARQGARRRGIRHRHAKATTGDDWLMQSDENLAMSIYLRYLANGEAIKVDVTSPGAKEAYRARQGADRAQARPAQFLLPRLPFSPQRGGLKWIRGQWLGEQNGQLDHFPTWRTSLQAIWDIRKRFQWCQVNIRADELPPDAKEYGDLELLPRVG